jgi:tRNA G18 (ribose-2'-O)-methylase SpoU
MAEGDLVVERALDAGCTPVAALAAVDLATDSHAATVVTRLLSSVDVFAASTDLRAAVTQLGVPLDVIAVFDRPAARSVDDLVDSARRIVVVEAVDNPVNVGSIVRNALGLGWDGLVLDRTSVDPLARRAVRVSMGHALHLPFARTDDLAAAVRSMRSAGFTVCALTPADDAVDIIDVDATDRLAVVVGAERAGLSEAVADAATMRVRIPMQHGVDSLNVAAATAIACHALGLRA